LEEIVKMVTKGGSETPDKKMYVKRCFDEFDDYSRKLE